MKPGWLSGSVKLTDQTMAGCATERQSQLTKPPGSLGMLEALAVQLASLQRSEKPAADKIQVSIFAGDHGVAAAGVSAFPQEVTVQMVANFSAGGAAISVLARSLSADLEVVDVGTIAEPGPLPGVISRRAGAGTANFQVEDAMDDAQLAIALEAGHEAALRASKRVLICLLVVIWGLAIPRLRPRWGVCCSMQTPFNWQAPVPDWIVRGLPTRPK